MKWILSTNPEMPNEGGTKKKKYPNYDMFRKKHEKYFVIME